MSENHIGKVIQVTGPVLDIRFKEGELPDLHNAIEIMIGDRRLIAEVAQQVGDDVVLELYDQRLVQAHRRVEFFLHRLGLGRVVHVRGELGEQNVDRVARDQAGKEEVQEKRHDQCQQIPEKLSSDIFAKAFQSYHPRVLVAKTGDPAV